MTAYLEPYIGSTEFVVFTGRACPYCVGATRWLEARALAFVEVDIDEHHLRRPIVEDTGHLTVPAIFDLRDTTPVFVGGFDELRAYAR